MNTRVELVGILNVTPDSFSDGDLYLDAEKAIDRATTLFDEGASIVDIGAEATNHRAEAVSVDEEWRRLQPIVTKLLPDHPDLSFSIDTHHPEIVHKVAAVAMGKKFYVNDVTTFQDPDMIEAVRKHELHAIASHLPFLAQGDIAYAHDWLGMRELSALRDELSIQVEVMQELGIPPEHIIVDPGIGFGKSMAFNWELLEFAGKYGNRQIMICHSRKSFLATDPVTGRPEEHIDCNDIAVNLAAAKKVIKAANGKRLFLRIHDVAPHKTLVDEIMRRSE